MKVEARKYLYDIRQAGGRLVCARGPQTTPGALTAVGAIRADKWGIAGGNV